MSVTFGLKPDEFDLDNIQRSFHAAEQSGFDSGWMGDHLHETIITEDRSLAEAWTTLSYMSGQLEKLRLGISVLNINWRHPVLTAKMGANLDIISRGRFELVLGLGEREAEYTSYGFPFGSPAERIEKCREFSHVLKELWTSSQFTFNGKYYTLQNAEVKPKPVQKPHPPIAVGALRRRLITALPQWGVGWYVADLSDFRPYIEMVKWMNDSCRQHGLDIKQIKRGARLQIIIGETEKELEETVRRTYENSAFKIPNGTSLARYRDMYPFVAGTPDRIRAVIAGFVDLGVSNIIVSFMDPEFRENDFHSLELFAKEVIDPIKSGER
jgi:alkanesulfonate monooxygenase SsuD/methylene tetrahydromethanopterin reductase-like flavin-dependent oxidoreductase (luciferase family)